MYGLVSDWNICRPEHTYHLGAIWCSILVVGWVGKGKSCEFLMKIDKKIVERWKIGRRETPKRKTIFFPQTPKLSKDATRDQLHATRRRIEHLGFLKAGAWATLSARDVNRYLHRNNKVPPRRTFLYSMRISQKKVTSTFLTNSAARQTSQDGGDRLKTEAC